MTEKSFQKGDHVWYEGEEWVIASPGYDMNTDPYRFVIAYNLVPPKLRRGSLANSVTKHGVLHTDLSPVFPVEPKFQVGDKVRTVVGEVKRVDTGGNVFVRFSEKHSLLAAPVELELVERPEPPKKPGSIWSKEGVELIFLDDIGQNELYWYGGQRRTVTHSKGYASTFTEVTK